MMSTLQFGIISKCRLSLKYTTLNYRKKNLKAPRILQELCIGTYCIVLVIFAFFSDQPP